MIFMEKQESWERGLEAQHQRAIKRDEEEDDIDEWIDGQVNDLVLLVMKKLELKGSSGRKEAITLIQKFL